MLDDILFYESSAFLQIFHDDLISILHIKSFIFRYFLCESSVIIQRNWRVIRMNQLLLNTYLVILLTKAWRAVDYSCTVAVSYEVSSYDSEASVLLSLLEEIEERDVLSPFELASLLLLEDLVLVLSEVVFQSDFSHYEYFVSL